MTSSSHLGLFFKGFMIHFLAISSACDRKIFLKYTGKLEPMSSILYILKQIASYSREQSYNAKVKFKGSIVTI